MRANRLPCAALVVVLALVAAACGGAGKTTARTSARGSTTTAPAVTTPTTAVPSTTSTSLRPASVQVPVTPCPIPASDYAGTPEAPESPPPTLSVATSLMPATGVQVYGSAFPGGSGSYLLAPTSSTCQGAWSSADGGMIMTAILGSKGHRGVTMVLRAGGVGPQTDLACPYIPAVLAADEAMRGSASLCAHPSEDVVRQIPTGSANLYSAVVWVPAQVKDPNLQGSGDGAAPTVALYTAQVFPPEPHNATATADAQMIACTLVPAQRDICTASLQFFLATQSAVGAHVGTADLAQMGDALSVFVAER